VFVNAVAAVHLGGTHVTEKCAELLTLRQDLKSEIGRYVPGGGPQSGSGVSEWTQEVVSSFL